jgi:hypothetical protein
MRKASSGTDGERHFPEDEFWLEPEHNEQLGKLFTVPGRAGRITGRDLAAGREAFIRNGDPTANLN